VKAIEQLHVRHAIEGDDAHSELVSMLHFFDRFLSSVPGERLVAPIVEETVMQPALIDRRQLAAKTPVEILDDHRIASHAAHSFLLWRDREHFEAKRSLE
jgi:hypothetical protein